MALGFKNIYFSILQVCIKLPVYINADFRQSKDVHFISETFSLIKLVTSMSRQRRRGICQKSMQFKYNLINIRMNKRNKRGFSPSPSYRKPPFLNSSVHMHSLGNACNWQLHATKSKSKCVSRHLNNLPHHTHSASFNWMNCNSILASDFRILYFAPTYILRTSNAIKASRRMAVNSSSQSVFKSRASCSIVWRSSCQLLWLSAVARRPTSCLK